MGKKKNIITMVLLSVICLFSTALSTKVFAESEDKTITNGVYIDSVQIGGMTPDEAKQAVDQYVDALKSRKVIVKIDGNTESITLKKLGYDYKKNDFVNQAVLIGKTGNLIKRYKELKDTEKSNLVYHLEFDINEKKLKEFVKDNCSKFDIPAANAGVKRENGSFVYTDHKTGRKLDVDKTADSIKAAILNNGNQEDLAVDAVVEDDIPKYTREDVEKCNMKLGSYSTTYTTSSADRAGNLANGARLINNTVLYPGDVFSAYDKLNPFTIENGYYEAGAYSNGKVIDSIGGGACQVTTTLYNAVLFSELDVVERKPHSMTISYVDLSRDAAIAGTWKDLKFKNDTKSPVLIEAYTSGRTITFNIWGNEIRDTKNRTIKFKTVVLREKAPGKDVVTKDPAKPTTYSLTTQSAHTGYVAELYKIVYENGVEVSRTRVNKSVYNPAPKYITVGTKEIEEEPDEESADNTSEESADNTSEESADNTPEESADDTSDESADAEDVPAGDDTAPKDSSSHADNSDIENEDEGDEDEENEDVENEPEEDLPAGNMQFEDSESANTIEDSEN